MDAGSLSKLRVANGHLADPVRLRALFADEGYLFFRDVLDKEAVLAVGEKVIGALADHGLVLPGDDDRLQDVLNEQRLWENLVAVPAIAAFFAKIAGTPAGFIPLARYRVMPPGGSTQVHHDAVRNPGFDMTTAWIPLMTIDEELGGLAVESGGCWRWHAYEPGDVVFMHEAMTHTGLANRSRDELRISVDVRFQNPGAAAAVVGRICAVDAVSVSVETQDGEVVTLGVDDTTLLRAGSGQTIPRAELLMSELVPGRRVIASRRDGRAVMVKPL